MGRHGAQPQKREALRTPYLKIGNLRFRSNLHDALDANRARFAALHAKPVEHVAGRKVVVRRLKRVRTTNHDPMVDPAIACVHPLPGTARHEKPGDRLTNQGAGMRCEWT